jgi:hypothetical protein
MSIGLLVAYVVGLIITFFIVRAAVISALASHYKTVRWYEATGEWVYAPPSKGDPRDLPAESAPAQPPLT